MGKGTQESQVARQEYFSRMKILPKSYTKDVGVPETIESDSVLVLLELLISTRRRPSV